MYAARKAVRLCDERLRLLLELVAPVLEDVELRIQRIQGLDELGERRVTHEDAHLIELAHSGDAADARRRRGSCRQSHATRLRSVRAPGSA